MIRSNHGDNGDSHVRDETATIRAPTPMGERLARRLLLRKNDTTTVCREDDIIFHTSLAFMTFCGLAMVAPLYGFNVYILPLLNVFYGDNDDTQIVTMAQGIPAYTAGLAVFATTINNFVVAPQMAPHQTTLHVKQCTTDKPRSTCRSLPQRSLYGHIYTRGLIYCCTGLLLTWVSIHYRQLWLFVIAYGVIFGYGTGFMNLPLLTNIVLWYRHRYQRPGVGSGVMGFLAGVWPALLAYMGPALYNTVGVAVSFFVLAALLLGLGWWVPFVLYPPHSLQRVPSQRNDKSSNKSLSLSSVKSTSSDSHISSSNKPASGVNDSPPNARMDNALGDHDIFFSRQFWLIAVLYFFTLVPGFGVKLVVAPLVQSVFRANASTQAIASSAIARLAMGFITDRYPAKALLQLCLLVQCIVCIVLGVIIWYATGDTHKNSYYVWAFAVVNMILGSTMAAAKVLYSVFVLTIFGAPSLGTAMGRLFLGLGLSALAGPVAMWSVLVSSQQGLVGGTSTSTTTSSTTFVHSVSLFFWCSAVGTLLAFILLLFVHPYRFQPSLPKRDDSLEDGLFLTGERNRK